MRDIAQKKTSNNNIIICVTPLKSERREDPKNSQFEVTKREIIVHGLFCAMIRRLNAHIMCYGMTHCLS